MAKRQAQPVDNLDKLEQCVSEARLVEVGSLISWWMSPAQRSRFPLLSSMAINVLSIPAISPEAVWGKTYYQRRAVVFAY